MQPRWLHELDPDAASMSRVVLALCIATASAFGTRGGSARGLTKMSATAMSQDELKKQVGYQAIDDYVRSRVPGARRAARHRARRDDPRQDPRIPRSRAA